MAKIRVLQLTTDSKIAGAEVLLLLFAQGYDRNKFDVHFCTLAPRGDFHLALQERGVKGFSLDVRNLCSLPAALMKLRKIIRRKKIDIVHTHLHHASFLGMLAARTNRVPIPLLTRHYTAYFYAQGNTFHSYLDKISSRLAVKIISVSEAVKSSLMQAEGLDGNKIVTIYNGIDPARFDSVKENLKRKLLTELRVNDRYPVLGHIATLHPCKGHIYLFKALISIRKVYPNVLLLVVGDGLMRKELRTYVAEGGLSENIVFTGHRREIPEILSLIDIAVQPSIDEALGISILEAMAAGKPVVATRLGGIPEIVNQGETGLLIQPKNPMALSKAILKLATDRKLAQRMGRAGRLRVAKRFGIQNMIKKTEALYEQLFLEKGLHKKSF